LLQELRVGLAITLRSAGCVTATGSRNKVRRSLRLSCCRRQETAGIESGGGGHDLAPIAGMRSTLDIPTTRTEILVGRGLAMCVHPYAAWRVKAPAGRLLVLFAYFAAGFALVLTSLFAF
jgi:hypothetical protein